MSCGRPPTRHGARARGDTEAKDYGVNTVMGTYADTLDAMFVLAIGDNMYDTGVTSVDDPQFQSKFEEPFTAESLNIPWYVVGGNHDYYGSIDAQIQYSDKSYRWIFPDYYYSQTVTGDDGTTALLVGIDTWRLNGGDTYVSHDPVTGRSHLRSRALVEVRPAAVDAARRGAARVCVLRVRR